MLVVYIPLNPMKMSFFHGWIPMFLRSNSELIRGDAIVEVNGVRSVEGMLQKCKAPNTALIYIYIILIIYMYFCAGGVYIWYILSTQKTRPVPVDLVLQIGECNFEPHPHATKRSKKVWNRKDGDRNYCRFSMIFSCFFSMLPLFTYEVFTPAMYFFFRRYSTRSRWILCFRWPWSSAWPMAIWCKTSRSSSPSKVPNVENRALSGQRVWICFWCVLALMWCGWFDAPWLSFIENERKRWLNMNQWI